MGRILLFLLAPSILAGCATGSRAGGLPPPLPPAPPDFCAVAGRLAEAGFLKAPWPEVDEAAYRAALERLAAAAGIDAPAALPLPGDHPLSTRLLLRPVRPSTLQACAASRPAAPSPAPAAEASPPPVAAAGVPPASTAPPAPVAVAPAPVTTAGSPPVPVAKPPPPRRPVSVPQKRRPRPEPSRAVEVGQAAYAVEKLSCEGQTGAGAWVLLLEGEVTARGAQDVAIRVRRRYGVRYWPGEEGADATHWYCIPRRRYCWSEVGFADWQGRVRAGDLLRPPAAEVFPARLRFPIGLGPIIRARCGP